MTITFAVFQSKGSSTQLTIYFRATLSGVPLVTGFRLFSFTYFASFTLVSILTVFFVVIRIPWVHIFLVVAVNSTRCP